MSRDVSFPPVLLGRSELRQTEEILSLRDALRAFTRQDIEALCRFLQAWIRALRMEVPSWQVEDLVQDTLVHLWIHDRPLNVGGVSSYIRACVRNAAFAEWRRRHRKGQGERPGQPFEGWMRREAVSPENPEETVLHREEIRLLFRHYFQRFPRPTVAALYLTQVLGFTCAETAHHLAISGAACESRMGRARRRLRQEVASVK